MQLFVESQDVDIYGIPQISPSLQPQMVCESSIDTFTTIHHLAQYFIHQ